MAEQGKINRRLFLSGLGAIVGGIAIEKAIPFNRVWSFPEEIKCVNAVNGTIQEIESALEYAWANYAVAPTHFIGPFDPNVCRLYGISSCREWESLVNAT